MKIIGICLNNNYYIQVSTITIKFHFIWVPEVLN